MTSPITTRALALAALLFLPAVSGAAATPRRQKSAPKPAKAKPKTPAPKPETREECRTQAGAAAEACRVPEARAAERSEASAPRSEAPVARKP